ncbi:hypothetical protein M3Y97_01148000 [Aphelenchoides bicaudatus]|nr:hypothetical protein M3Y97_01148000 [Aphelenchoides bicaudatus]
MKDQPAIERHIREQILDGQSRKIIFDQICEKLNIQQELSAQATKKLFAKSDKKDWRGIPKSLTNVITLVDAEFKKAKRGVEGRKCVEFFCKIQLISQRYALEVKKETKLSPCSIYLYDMLVSQRQKLEVDGDLTLSKDITADSGFLLDSTHFLIVNHFEKRNLTTSTTVFQLMELDIPNLTCKLLDSVTKKDRFYSRLAKITSGLEFVCDVQGQDDQTRFHRCRVINSKLQFDENLLSFEYVGNGAGQQRNRLNGVLRTHQVVGDKTYGFANSRTFEDHSSDNYIINEVTIENNKIVSRKVAGFVLKDNEGSIPDCAAWIGKQCFVIIPCMNSQRMKCFLYKFDMETQQVTKMDWIGYDCNMHEMRSDDGILTICTKHYSSEQHKWQWIPVTHPDSLFNLTAKWIRQWTLFMSPGDYNKFMDTLPPKIRAFKC